jgi:hypothetical protein
LGSSADALKSFCADLFIHPVSSPQRGIRGSVGRENNNVEKAEWNSITRIKGVYYIDWER